MFKDFFKKLFHNADKYVDKEQLKSDAMNIALENNQEIHELVKKIEEIEHKYKEVCALLEKLQKAIEELKNGKIR